VKERRGERERVREGKKERERTLTKSSNGLHSKTSFPK